MNKEQQELLDEAYENYIKWWEESDDSCNLTEEQSNKWLKLIDGGLQWAPFSQEEFIHKCKTDPEFSERWGLTIEERELSWEERRDLLTPEQYDGTALNKYGHKDCGFGYISPFTDKVIHYWMNLHNIPTKIVTLTYNDKTIESYES